LTDRMRRRTIRFGWDEQRGVPHVELEIRQDLLASESDVQSWAERLGGVLEEAVPHLFPR
jgi:predicted N-formylglutamate amidohydrolase